MADDPALERSLKPLRSQLAKVRASRLAGHYMDLEATSAALVEACRAVAFAPMLAEALLLHGAVLGDLGQFEAAVEHFEEAWRAALGSQRDSIAVLALIQMAEIHRDRQARFEDALRRLSEAEMLLERMPDVEAARLESRIWNVWSGLHIARSEHDEAEVYLEQILATQKESQGGEQLTIASTLNRLAAVRARQTRYEASKAALDQALGVYREYLGPNHPRIATILNNLGVVSDLRGRPQESEDYYRAAIELTRTILGPSHPKLVKAYSNVGLIFAKRGAYARSVEALRESLRIAEQSLGFDHPGTATVLTNLGGVLVELGQFDSAEDLLKRALETRTRVLGTDDPNVAHSLMTLGRLEAARHRMEDAISSFRQALAIENEDSAIALTQHHLGVALRESGQFEEAEEQLTAALALRQRIFGSDHPDLARTLLELGRLHLKRSQNADALRLLESVYCLESIAYLSPAEKAAAHFTFANAVWRSGQSRSEAVDLAR